MSKTVIRFPITARIDRDDRLVLEAVSEDDEFRLERLEDLGADPSEVDEIVLEVSDFYQNDTMYEVRGAVLAADNHRIVAYWPRDPDGAGVCQRFANPRPGQARAPGFVIDAIPADPRRPRPAPALVGGGLPASDDEQLGGGGPR